MRRTASMLALVLIVAGCGNATEDASGGTLTSDGGLATIQIADGSLPDGVSIDAISIEATTEFASDERFPVVAVGLFPHGTQLDAPATVTISVPNPVPDGFVAIHQSGTYIQFLDADLAATEDEPTTVTVQVDSFSSISIYRTRMDATLSTTPSGVEEGQEQTASAAVTIPGASFGLIAGSSDVPYRYYEFAGPTLPVTFTGGQIEWLIAENWSPPSVPVEMTDTPEGGESAPATSTCAKAYHFSDVLFAVDVGFSSSLLSASDLEQSEGLSSFAKFLVGDEGTTAGQDEFIPGKTFGGNGPWLALEELGPGTTFEATAEVTDRIKAPCAPPGTGGGTTSTSSTSTTAPDPGDGSQDDPEGDNLDSGSSVGSEANADASDIVSTNAVYDAENGCYIITMKVKGDGESATENPQNKWYNPTVIVRTSDGGFDARVNWGSGEERDVRVSQPNGDPITGAAVTTEWLDPSTLEVIVKNVGEGDIDTSTIELSTRFTDADGNNLDTYFDDAVWQAQ